MVPWQKHHSGRVESVAQWVLWGQDEHEVAVGVTRYTFSAEQQERVVMSSTAIRTMDVVY